MRLRSIVLVTLLLTAVVGSAVGGGACAASQPVDEDAVAGLKDKPGAFLSGRPLGLGAPEVVNRRDFVYAVGFGRALGPSAGPSGAKGSPDATDGDVLAFVHHVTTHMELTATLLSTREQLYRKPVNANEFDVEDLVVLDSGPAAGTIVMPSRQGIARAVNARTGEPAREIGMGVALVRVAASPDGALLAFGTTDGRVFFVDAADFSWRGQARPHTDEVHGLAFLADGRLLSAGFDGALAISRVVPATDVAAHGTVRAPSMALKTGERAFLTHLDGKRAISTVRDVRQPSCAITTAAVKRLGLAARSTGVVVEMASGSVTAPGVELGRVQVQTLDLGPLEAAVCDTCVPAGAELVLGRAALARASFGDDVAHDEVIVTPAAIAGAPARGAATTPAPGAGTAATPAPGAGTAATPASGAGTAATPAPGALGSTPGGAAASSSAPLVEAPVATARLIAKAVGLVEEGRVALPGPATDLDVSRSGAVLVTFSHARAERSYDIHDAEKKGAFPPPSVKSGAALVDVARAALGRTFVSAHRGFTTTGAISPDGRTVVTGGWDRRVLVFDAHTGERVTQRELAWLVRRVRFAPDGHLLAVAAWTPVNALNEGDSEPALLLYPVALDGAKVVATR